MAIYHLSAQVIKRSEGRSSIAAAAYRAGERLVDQQTGHVSDYRNRSGVVHTEIRTPQDAPAWMQDRETLWNVLEGKNRRKDAQLAREMNIALPRELPFAQQKALMQRFIDDQFVARGMVADLAIHHDPEGHNPHAHVMLTFYAANERGFLRTRTREWNSKEFLAEVRASWCVHANSALIAIGSDERIDHRTLESQGIDRAPTIHEGVKGRKAQDRGHEPISNVVELKTYAGKRRRVDYREIDEGRTRAGYNARILQFNDRHMSRKLVEALHAAESYMHHRFLEATVRRSGVRLRDARRGARSAAGSEAFWRTVLKQRERAAMVERMLRSRRPGERRLARKVELVQIARRKIAAARKRAWWAAAQVSIAKRDYESAKLALGKDRQERRARKKRAVARWMGAFDRIAPQTVRLDRLLFGRRDPLTRTVAGWFGNAARSTGQTHDAARADDQLQGWKVPPSSVTAHEPLGDDQQTAEGPTPVEIAVAARAAVQKQTDGMERLNRLDAQIVRLERLVRTGQADATELETARAERITVTEAIGGENAWQRQANLKAAYGETLDHLKPEEVAVADIPDEQRNALLFAKRQREGERATERQLHEQKPSHRHRYDWNQKKGA